MNSKEYNTDQNSRVEAVTANFEVIDEIITLLKERFQDFLHVRYQVMTVFDPKSCTDPFKSSLAATSFNKDKVIPEWKSLRNFVKIWMKM